MAVSDRPGIRYSSRLMKRNGKHKEVIRKARGYPRPQLERAAWISLNGRWDFAIDHNGRITSPDAVKWDSAIEVPFSPETPASGACGVVSLAADHH